MNSFKLSIIAFLCLMVFSCLECRRFKLTVTSIEGCNLPASRFDKENYINTTLSARKITRQSTLIKAKFTVPKLIGPIFFSLRGYQLQQNNAKDLMFKLEKLKCNHTIPTEVTKVLKLAMDGKCYLLPQAYEVDGINVNDYEDFFSKSVVTPGRYAYDIDFLTSKGLVTCLSITCDFTKIKHK